MFASIAAVSFRKYFPENEEGYPNLRPRQFCNLEQKIDC